MSTQAKNDALRVIRDEHRSISAVLLALKELARMAEKAPARPDFSPVRAMLLYIDEYPERFHHPKEDEHLFARLAARAPQALALIGALQAEHVRGAHLIRELERAFLFLEDAWPARGAEFRQAVDAYAEFHWDHMRKEERELLPLAERHLSDEDWKEIAAAFCANRDPAAGVEEGDYAALFGRIVNIAPAPVGLGEPWAQSA